MIIWSCLFPASSTSLDSNSLPTKVQILQNYMGSLSWYRWMDWISKLTSATLLTLYALAIQNSLQHLKNTIFLTYPHHRASPVTYKSCCLSWSAHLYMLQSQATLIYTPVFCLDHSFSNCNIQFKSCLFPKGFPVTCLLVIQRRKNHSLLYAIFVSSTCANEYVFSPALEYELPAGRACAWFVFTPGLSLGAQGGTLSCVCLNG